MTWLEYLACCVMLAPFWALVLVAGVLAARSFEQNRRFAQEQRDWRKRTYGQHR